MNILSALRKKKVERSFFLALLLKPYSVGTILFEKDDNTLHILASKDTAITKKIEDIHTDDLVKAADEVITFIEGSLPAGEQVDRTIFVLPRDWQEEGKIKKDFQPRLRKLCEELSLKPEGYIISIEAIITALYKKEGVPIKALFVEVANKLVRVYLVRNSSIVQELHDTVEYQSEAADAVEKLFTQLEAVDVLPPKIFVLDYEGAETIQQEFLSRDWKKELPFLHLPQVVILERGFENEAVISGVAAQMESRVVEEEKGIPSDEPATVEEPTESEEESKMDASASFGFEKDVDVRMQPEAAEETEEPVEEKSMKDEFADEESPDNESEIEDEKPTHHRHHEPAPTDTLLTRIQSLNPLTIVKNMKLSPAALIGLPKKLTTKMSVKGWGIVIAVLAVLIGGIYVYYAQILHAEVVVFADRRAVDKAEMITLSPNKDTSASDMTLKAEVIPLSIDGQGDHDATGSKDTGDKATGQVTIYNKTSDPQKFSKGTKISANNLDFVLQDDVQVASTSSFSTSFSSASVKVQASQFGKEYNLPSGTNFTVDGGAASDFFAKNDMAFSGGTKKTVKVVSNQDLSDLQNQVLQSLTKQAQTQSQSQISSDEVLLPSALSADFTSKKFSQKAGDQASSVHLNATVQFKLGAYRKTEEIQLVKDLTSSQVPQGYALDSSSDIELNNVTVNKDESAKGDLSIHAVYMPTLDSASISKMVIGKSVSSAENAVKKISGVSDAHINIQTLPLLPQILPLNPKHVTITVRSDG